MFRAQKALFLFLVSGLTAAPPPRSIFRLHPRDYSAEGISPSSEQSETCRNLRSVKFLYFGPKLDEERRQDPLYQSALFAIREENEKGGYKGVPFEIKSVWSRSPWGQAVTELTKSLYSERIWGIIASVDGNQSHLAEQVAAKARVVVINPCATDKSINLANVPWIFSCLPSDRLLADSLASIFEGIGIEDHCGRKRSGWEYEDPDSLVILQTLSHDQRLFGKEFLKALRKRRVNPSRHLVFEPKEKSLEFVCQEILRVRPGWVALIADPKSSARIVSILRKKLYNGVILGGPWLGTLSFQKSSGRFREGCVFPLPVELKEPGGPFAKFFREKFKTDPDYLCCSVYDSVKLLINAVRKGGLSRAKIRKALEVPARGITGVFRWDPQGSNTREVKLAVYKGGKITAYRGGAGLRKDRKEVPERFSLLLEAGRK